MKKIAIVRIRGQVNIRKVVKNTLDMLRLYDKNYCVFIESTPQNLGMLKKVKDFVTYGEVSEEIYNEILAKRGEEYTGRETDSRNKIKYERKYYNVDGKKIKKFFRLSPPRKGFGRKGIKKSFIVGGATGDRKDKINDLLSRMI